MKLRSEFTRISTLSLGHFVNDLCESVVPPLLPLLSSLYRFSYAFGGMLVAIYSVSSTLFQPLFGVIYDRWPKRWFAPLGILIGTLFMALIGVTSNILLLISVVSIAAIGSAIFHPVFASLASSTSSSNRGLSISITFAGGSLGVGVGSVMIVVLTGMFGLKSTLLLTTLGVTTFLLFLKVIPTSTIRIGKPDLHIFLRHIKNRLKTIRNIIIITTLRNSAFLGLFTFLPSYGVHLGMSTIFGGLLSFVLMLSITIGQLIGGFLADRYGLKKITFLTLFCATPFMLMMLFPTGLIWLFLFLTGSCFGASVPLTTLLSQQALSNSKALASSFAMGVPFLFASFSLVMVGVGIDIYGFNMVFLILSFMPSLASILARSL